MMYISQLPLLSSGFRPCPYTRTFLALRSKSTGKTRLVEANTVPVAAMVQPPKSTNLTVLESVERELQGGEIQHPSGAEARKKLVKSFGQAKGQRIYALADRMAVSEAQLEKNMANTANAVDSSALVVKVADALPSVIPERNRSVQGGRAKKV